MLTQLSIEEGLQALAVGQVIAYPTEAVYGLGCDPFQTGAVEHILNLKGRPKHKGMILLIADWAQLDPLIDQSKIPSPHFARLQSAWPGRETWLFPKSARVPDLVCGQHNSVAIRMTTHPIAKALCANGPIISTSANVSKKPPATSQADLTAYFAQGLAGVVSGQLGSAKTVSPIYDMLTGAQLR